MDTIEAKRLWEAFRTFFPEAETLGSYIGGALHAGTGDEILLQNPATGRDVFVYRDAGPELSAHAASAAARAQEAWALVPHAERGRILHAVGGKIRAHAEEL